MKGSGDAFALDTIMHYWSKLGIITFFNVFESLLLTKAAFI